MWEPILVLPFEKSWSKEAESSGGFARWARAAGRGVGAFQRARAEHHKPVDLSQNRLDVFGRLQREYERRKKQLGLDHPETQKILRIIKEREELMRTNRAFDK